MKIVLKKAVCYIETLWTESQWRSVPWGRGGSASSKFISQQKWKGLAVFCAIQISLMIFWLNSRFFLQHCDNWFPIRQSELCRRGKDNFASEGLISCVLTTNHSVEDWWGKRRRKEEAKIIFSALLFSLLISLLFSSLLSFSFRGGEV